MHYMVDTKSLSHDCSHFTLQPSFIATLHLEILLVLILRVKSENCWSVTNDKSLGLVLDIKWDMMNMQIEAATI